ncbi:hypothetical protein GGER_44550 [Serratia rubidaea]
MNDVNNQQFPILLVSLHKDASADDRALDLVKQALSSHNHYVLQTAATNNLLDVIKHEIGIGCVIIHECESVAEAERNRMISKIIQGIRTYNSRIPIFLPRHGRFWAGCRRR